MSRIPVESGEIEHFTPPSLAEAMGDDAPKFRLKSPSERCVRRFRQLLDDEGLESFSDAAFTAEKLRAIPLYWSEDDARGLIDRLNTLIALEKQNRDNPEWKPAEEDMAWLDHLDDALFDVHKPLRVMRRKTGEFQEYAPRLAIAVYVAGWSGLDVPFRLDAGVIASETVRALANALGALGEKHVPATPTMPFLELYVAASKRLRLDEDEEKNSPAPSPHSVNPDASTRTPSTAGASTGASGEDASTSSTSPRTKTPASA